MRTTPFGFVFGDVAARRFPAVVEALRQEDADPADRDRFTLVEPVARLLRELVPEGAGADELEAHVVLLHHAFLYWAHGARLYRVGDASLRRALAEPQLSSELPQRSIYLQLPELRVWGAPRPGAAPEPLDGMFVSATPSGGIAVLAIFGLRPDRPGFSAVGFEGHADDEDLTPSEVAVAATRDDGSPVFGPLLPGGSAAGLYSVANTAELFLLTYRLLTLLPSAGVDADEPDQAGSGDGLEHVVSLE